MQQTNVKRLSVVLVALTIFAALGLGAWFAWQKNSDDSNYNRQGQSSHHADSQFSDPTEGGKYLVITEWGVRFLLPKDLRGEVAYSLGTPITDENNTAVQAAKVLIKGSSSDICKPEETANGAFIDAAAQLLRSEVDPSLDTQRYKGKTTELLVSGDYVYHLNYVTSVCASEPTIAKIDHLLAALKNIEKVN